MDKSLESKAIDYKGKKYVEVKERILYFNSEYENGSIETFLISDNEEIVIKAKITPNVENPNRYFTGYAQEIKGSNYINKTSALENAETSAVGRAFAMMGIGIIDSIASIDEITQAGNRKHVNTPQARKLISPEQSKELTTALETSGKMKGALQYISDNYGLGTFKDLDTDQFKTMIKKAK